MKLAYFLNFFIELFVQFASQEFHKKISKISRICQELNSNKSDGSSHSSVTFQLET